MPSTQPTFESVNKADAVAQRVIEFSRDSLVRYAGASGDFNPIHYNDDFARSVGLPSVIAHGMLTMGSVVAPVVEWLGDPGLILEYETRFTKPVEVPALGTARIDVKAVVGALDEAARTARIDITASVDNQKILTKTRVTVKLV